MQPSSNASSRGPSRVGSVKYAHSPYAYRTSVDDAPVSPLSDYGARPDASGPVAHQSPASPTHSASAQEPASTLVAVQVDSTHQLPLSQPGSPLCRSTGGQEYSQPIQVGSAPNVHARYRRGMQSPMTRGGNGDSGSRSAFPRSPPASLPPRSPCNQRDDSAFLGGESAPVRVQHSTGYRMAHHSGGGYSAPQYTMPLSGGYGGGGSGTQSPGPHYSSRGAPYSSPPPPPGSAMPPHSTAASSQHTSPTTVNGAGGAGYAPVGFSMPPTMVSAPSNVVGSGGRGPSLSSSHVDPRSGHASPLMLGGSGSGGRLAPQGSSFHNRDPISPTRQYNGGAAPPPFVATAAQQQQQQHSQLSGTFRMKGNTPLHSRAGSGGYSTSPVFGGGGVHGGGAPPAAPTHSAETLMAGESYDTAKTLSTMADETMSFSGKSGSSASSIRDDLPLCPNDDACTLINDRKHQRKYAHTCRLFPCYHGHVTRHAKLFRHSPGQVSLPEGLSANTKVSTQALASVNFSTISPEAPNAYRIYVSHGDKSYEIFGDWASVKVHTFKRYLHQVYHIAPCAQVLTVVKANKVMDDDINTVKCYGIEEDSVIQLSSTVDSITGPGRMRISLDDL